MKKIREQLLARMVLIACATLLTFRTPQELQAGASATASPNVVFAGHIGGSIHAVGVQGNYAYIGEGPTVVVLDISDPALPTVVGRTHPLPSSLLPDSSFNIWDLHIVGSYAYVAGDSGMWIGDVFDPTVPVQVGFCDTPAPALGVTVVGNYAYVAHWDGLSVVDVSDLANPAEVGSYGMPRYVHGVTVEEEHAYVAAGRGGLRILDISSPSNPTEVGSCPTPSCVYDVVVRGGYAYVADESGGLRVIDISDPASPTEVGFYDTGGSAQGVAVTGDYAYIADANGGLRVIDISDPSSPIEAGSYNPSPPGWVQDVAVVEGYAYVTDLERGLWVVNVTDPAEPSGSSFYRPPISPGAIAITEDYAYTAARERSLWVLDITNPANPPVSFDHFFTYGSPQRMTIAKGYIYAVTDWALDVVDITDPTSPTLVGHCSIPGSTDDVFVVGDFAYVAGCVPDYDGLPSLSNILAPPPLIDACLWVVNVADPAHPEVIGSRCMTSGYCASGVTVAENYAYVVGVGLWIIDIADPANPSEVGFVSGPREDVVTLGTYAYVVNSYYNGFCVVDISDPTNPTEVGCHDIPGKAIATSPIGGYLYIVDYSTGLHVVDVSDPANPVEVDSYHIGLCNDMATSGNYIGIATEYGGVFLLHHATGTPHQIAGRVLDNKGNPIKGILVATNTGYTATTDGNGYYTFTNVLPGTYTLTPRTHGYSWSPANRTITIPPNATGQDFVGEALQIAGRVLDNKGNPIGSILVTTNSGHTATTDANGHYTFTNVLPGTYTLTPKTCGYFWSPANHTATIPPNAIGRDFVGRNILKHSIPAAHQALGYGDTLSYTLDVVYPDDHTVLLYDQVSTHTTYVSDSLSAPMSIAYDPIANAISGTLSLTATVPTTISFSARVEITGTVDLAPIIVNQACIHPIEAGLDECEWSNQTVNFTYVWPLYFPFIFWSAAPGDS